MGSGDGEHSDDRDDDPPRARADGFRHHRGQRHPMHAGQPHLLAPVWAAVSKEAIMIVRTFLNRRTTTTTARHSTRSWTGGSRRLGHRRRSRRPPRRRWIGCVPLDWLTTLWGLRRAAGSPACAPVATAQRSDPFPPAQDHTHCFGLLSPVATALCLGCLCRDCFPRSAAPSGRRSRGARLPSLAGMTGRARGARCSKAWEARCSIAAWSLKARPTPSTGRCWARSLAALRWGCGRDIYPPVGRGVLRAC